MLRRSCEFQRPAKEKEAYSLITNGAANFYKRKSMKRKRKNRKAESEPRALEDRELDELYEAYQVYKRLTEAHMRDPHTPESERREIQAELEALRLTDEQRAEYGVKGTDLIDALREVSSIISDPKASDADMARAFAAFMDIDDRLSEIIYPYAPEDEYGIDDLLFGNVPEPEEKKEDGSRDDEDVPF